jgi:hypothetical protein
MNTSSLALVDINYAAVGKEQPWRAKQARKSPSYTTRLEELPVVK